MACVELDTASKSERALRVTMSDARLQEDQFWNLNTGASCRFTQTIPGGSELKVCFFAKSIAGRNFLRVSRPSGGFTSEAVEISNDWEKYEVTVSVTADTNSLMFALVPAAPRPCPGVQRCAEGEFLLDHVEIIENGHEHGAPSPVPFQGSGGAESVGGVTTLNSRSRGASNNSVAATQRLGARKAQPPSLC